MVCLDTQQQGQVKLGIHEINRLGGELTGEGNAAAFLGSEVPLNGK
jgi:hypothetical protein